MTTEHDMAVAMATEIGKQVPVKQVYEDAGSPAARQIGATLEDVVKVIRLVGLPIQWLAFQQDRFRAFIERAKDRVPADRLVLPAPQILGPVLEGIRYELHDTPITEMFANLLGAAMDSDRAKEVFPHFPALVNSLSPDEARILEFLTKKTIHAVHPVPGVVLAAQDIGHVYLVDEVRLDLPEHTNIYMDHLFTLGLINWFQERQEVTTFEGQKASLLFLRLSPMGRQLMKVCLPPPAPSSPDTPG